MNELNQRYTAFEVSCSLQIEVLPPSGRNIAQKHLHNEFQKRQRRDKAKIAASEVAYF